MWKKVCALALLSDLAPSLRRIVFIGEQALGLGLTAAPGPPSIVRRLPTRRQARFRLKQSGYADRT
jgi:hypothetical protein